MVPLLGIRLTNRVRPGQSMPHHKKLDVLRQADTENRRQKSEDFVEGAGEDGGVAGDEEVFFDPMPTPVGKLLAQRRVFGEALKNRDEEGGGQAEVRVGRRIGSG